MEISLAGRDFSLQPMPSEYELLPWNPSLLEAFAKTKYLSFRNELDSKVFPCLAEYEGCRRLMGEIARKPGFLTEATWLAVRPTGIFRKPEYCGTVQGVRDRFGLGAIQNLGVVPQHRQMGLGCNLLLLALSGFRQAGIGRAYLEVTSQNTDAIRLYRRLGFTTIRTVYKTVETPCNS
jgi:ribosomal protein S18 acetylase RimI-like enzyme